MTKIDGSALAALIEKELSAYAKSRTETMREVVEEVTEEAVTRLKATSPKRTGRYARGWKTKATRDSTTSLTKTIHNRQPGLTHLVEHGHAKASGGRVAGRPHIAPIEKEATKSLEARLYQEL